MNEMDHLQLTFFVSFQQFEAELKRKGYRKAGRADPDREFYKRAGRQYYSPNDASNAASYFREYPPKIQVLDGGQLSFAERELPPNPFDALVECVYRVRNNLFHGGKVPFAPERDRSLLEHSVQALREMNRVLERLPRHEPAGSIHIAEADFPELILGILQSAGGQATPLQVAKEFWRHNEARLRASDGLLFTWQCDLQCAANLLRERNLISESTDTEEEVWALTHAMR